VATRLLRRSFVAFTPFLLASIAALGFYIPLTPELLLACALGTAGLGITLFSPCFGRANAASGILLASAVAFLSGGLSADLAEGIPFLPPGVPAGTATDAGSNDGPPGEIVYTINGRALRDAAETASGLYRVPVRLKSVTTGDPPGSGSQSWPSRGTLLFRGVDGAQSVFGAPPLFWGDRFSAVGSLWCPGGSDPCLFMADTVSADAAVAGVQAGERGPLDRLLEGRREVRRTIGVSLGRLPGGVRALTGALVLGDRGFLGSEVVDRFRRAGLSHILALSGMHLGIVAGSGALVLGKCLGKSGGAVGGMAVAWGYLLLVGPGASLLRAAVMFSIWGLLRLSGRKEHPLNVLGYSFLALILLWPGGTRELGFSFSYLALGGLLLAGVPLGRFLQRWLPPLLAAPLGASVGAFLATAPLSLARFGFAAPIGIPASMVAAPVVVFVLWAGLLLLGGSLFGALVLPAYWLAREAQALLLGVVDLSAKVPVVSLPAAGPGLWALALLPLLVAALGVARRFVRVEARRRRLEEELLLV
jgi:ComEC/Rec2-related protein